MVNAGQAYRIIKQRLAEAGVEDAGFNAANMLEHIAGLDRFSEVFLKEEQWHALEMMATRRAAGEPLQYLLGYWAFLDLDLAVGPGVLIPRPETEEVCLAAAGLFQKDAAPVVLDLCAGTGALALGLQSRLPAAQVTAVEWEAEAFGYLCRNVEDFSAAHPQAPQAVQADAFTYYKGLAPGSIDLIVSNPPYVTVGEYETLAPELRHEPRQALVAEQQGLAFYAAIARDYKAALAPGGALVFEIGAGQGKAVAALLNENGYKAVEIRQDMAGHDRIAIGRKA